MASAHFFLLVALLAAIAMAAPNPIPIPKVTIEKRSFKVPRRLNPAHPGPNGFAAMKKVAMKYNMQGLKEGFIANSKATGAFGVKVSAADDTNGSTTGTVAANPGQNAALFLSPVSVGGQTLNLDFDSGSSDLYVILSLYALHSLTSHQMDVLDRPSPGRHWPALRLRRLQISHLPETGGRPVLHLLR
jgi:hypothetical protein